MKTANKLVVAALCAAGAASGAGAASPPVPSPAVETAQACNPHDIATAHHTIMLRGQPLAYTSHAGLLPIRDGETGETHGCMFFMAYTRDEKGAHRPRPLTFLWNGGPGSNSTWVHFEAFGPRRIVTGDTPMEPSPRPLRLEDNPATLLDQSDLVFVDPVGTGYSRPATAAYGTEFYNVRGDITSVSEFIRVYRTHFDVPDAPIFLVGESYGVWRAAGVAEELEKRGVPVAGAVLISGGIPVGPAQTWANKVALTIPNRTAAAFYYKKLSPDLQADFHRTIEASAKWSEDVYAPALARADQLSAQERADVAQQLSRFTGIDASKIDQTTMILPRAQFVRELLGNGKVLQALDVRLMGAEPNDGERRRLIEQYFRHDLRYETDLPYLGLGDDGYVPLGDAGRKSINERWGYNQMEGVLQPPEAADLGPSAKAVKVEANIGPGEHQPWLERAMKSDPNFKVLVVAGWYDSWNSCVGNDYVAAHLDPSIRGNISARCYESGHVIYRDKGPRAVLRDDMRRFYDATLAGDN
jgi:carboxypeptidase C (cathepsin A)